MWALVRGFALVVLAGTGALLAGQGTWLLELVDRSTDLVGIGPVTPRGHGPLASPMVVSGVAVGVLVALLHPGSRVVRQLVTLLHELGHTVIAAALGARPAGIVLRHDASGHARAQWVGHRGAWRRMALAAVAFVGLPAASAASAAGAQLLLLAGPEAVLWAVTAAGVVVAVLARSLWSLLVAVGLAGLAVVALHDAAEPWATGVVVAGVAATAVRAAVDSLRAAGRPMSQGDDARVVAGHLRLPARLVRLAQVAVAGALSAWALWLLLPAPPHVWPID